MEPLNQETQIKMHPKDQNSLEPFLNNNLHPIIQAWPDHDLFLSSAPKLSHPIDFWAFAYEAGFITHHQDSFGTIPFDDSWVSRKIQELERLYPNYWSWVPRKNRTPRVDVSNSNPRSQLESPKVEIEKNTKVFSEALKVVKRRGCEVHWVPVRNEANWRPEVLIPSLKDLCFRVLEENVEEVESLEGITDVMRDLLVWLLCKRRKMSKRVLELYLAASQENVRLSDCSWIEEKDFEEILRRLNRDQLKVLQLDFCGRCMTDRVLRTTLARFPDRLPSLTTISLKGAYSLSDSGLNILSLSAPSLTSVNLKECSLLTSCGINILAIRLKSVLRKLYIDNCQAVNVMLILPALKKLNFLETLTISGILNVSDKFIAKLVIAIGPNLKELSLRDCQNLTVVSMRAIAENCPQLSVLDIGNLKLSDSALEHLACGCRSIKKLNLQGNLFSDEVVAALLETSGESLTELSLNKVVKVAEYTALAISLRCYKNLQSLDLSSCRGITDQALGLIVDSCSNLRKLSLFGCSQITDHFLDGHSNCHVKITGLQGVLIVDQFRAPEFM